MDSSAGNVQRCFHSLRSVTAGKLYPDSAVARRDRSAGNVYDVFFYSAVCEFSDRNRVSFYLTSGYVDNCVSAGRIVVYSISCGTGGDILYRSAFNVKRTGIRNRIRSVAAGIITASVIRPGTGRAGNELTGTFGAAVFDCQRSFICNERGGFPFSGSPDDLEAVKIDRNVSA